MLKKANIFTPEKSKHTLKVKVVCIESLGPPKENKKKRRMKKIYNMRTHKALSILTLIFMLTYKR